MTSRLLRYHRCTPRHLSFCSEATIAFPTYDLISLTLRSISYELLPRLGAFSALTRLEINVCSRLASPYHLMGVSPSIIAWRLQTLIVQLTGFDVWDTDNRVFADSLWSGLLESAEETLEHFSIIGANSTFWRAAMPFLGPRLVALHLRGLDQAAINRDNFGRSHDTLTSRLSAPLLIHPRDFGPFATELRATLSRLPVLQSLSIDTPHIDPSANPDWQRLVSECFERGVVLTRRGHKRPSPLLALPLMSQLRAGRSFDDDAGRTVRRCPCCWPTE